MLKNIHKQNQLQPLFCILLVICRRYLFIHHDKTAEHTKPTPADKLLYPYQLRCLHAEFQFRLSLQILHTPLLQLCSICLLGRVNSVTATELHCVAVVGVCRRFSLVNQFYILTHIPYTRTHALSKLVFVYIHTQLYINIYPYYIKLKHSINIYILWYSRFCLFTCKQGRSNACVHLQLLVVIEGSVSNETVIH